jgi:N-acetylglucosaminyldiphosphoundecaprenol N-acetyl-beta-D-mannosaminyltransferase
MYILGVRIDTLSKERALERVTDFLRGNEGKMIFTPNPEMLVDAQKDTYFREILNEGNLNICDGKGIALVSKESIERISGVDFMIDICALAEKQGKTVYLLGSGSDEVVRNCKNELLKRFPSLRIVGIHKGPDIHDKVNEDQNDAVLENIIMTAPDILFVAFGHIKQEKWIYEFLPDLPSVRVAMGIGGSFDFISGKVKRAPKIFRDFGFEWLYRLMSDPRRLKRIWKATVVFLYLSFRAKSRNLIQK